MLGLPSERAADKWLLLLKHWEAAVETPEVVAQGANRPHEWPEIMMSTLPAPNAWPLIRHKLAALPQTDATRTVEALFDDLLGKDADVLRYLESKRNPNADPHKEDIDSPEEPISAAELPIALRARDSDLLEKIYVRMSYGEPWAFSNTGCPDVVRLFGPERGKRVLREMLEGMKTSLGRINGKETQNMVRSIVISDLANLKSPQWAIVRGMQDFPLVSAEIQQFGSNGLKNQGDVNNADWVYGLGLAKNGQWEQAEKVLVDASPYFNRKLARTKAEEQELFSLVSQLLDRKRIASAWFLYEDLGLSLGRLNEVVKRLDSWLAATDLTPEKRATYLEWKARIDCGQINFKRGITEYEEALRLNPTGSAYLLLSIAEATKDRGALDFVAQAAKGAGTRGSQLDLFDCYMGQNRLSEAQMAAIKAAGDTHNVNMSAEGQGRLLDAYPGTGTELCAIYYKENEPDQIITLLHEYPKWGAEDLFGVVGNAYIENYRTVLQEQPLGFYAAWALATTGNKDAAIRALHDLLFFNPTDEAYKLLNELEGAGALEFDDRIIEAKPFETRPWIWKGDLLRRLGKLKDAEKCVRASIALDPTDQSTQTGTRQIAFQVLSQILKSQGKPAAATAALRVYHGAQLAADAEAFLNAGMFSAAAQGYKQALALIPADRVSAVRYAVALDGIGKHNDALTAFKKSVELAPTSDGPGQEQFYDEEFFYLPSARDFLADARRDDGRRRVPLQRDVLEGADDAQHGSEESDERRDDRDRADDSQVAFQ